MLHFADMATHDNDNEEFSFITLGAATANVVRYLQKPDDFQEDKANGGDHGNDRANEETDEQRAQDQRRAIDQRLSDVAAFEKRFSPGYRSRRKRN